MSFVQTTTMTEGDFPDGDSISSRASTVIPEVTAASSEVAGPKSPQTMMGKTLCM